jgi:hypothetical protein
MECKSVEMTLHDDRDMAGRGSRDPSMAEGTMRRDDCSSLSLSAQGSKTTPLLVYPFAQLQLRVPGHTLEYCTEDTSLVLRTVFTQCVVATSIVSQHQLLIVCCFIELL